MHAELGQEEEKLVAGIAPVLVDEHLNSAGRMLLLLVLPFVEADAENIRCCLHSYLKPSPTVVVRVVKALQHFFQV